MVCPLRLVLAAASVALLLWSAAVLLLDTEAGEALVRRVSRPERSWWRFGVALFTGELIYAFYGKNVDEVSLCCDVQPSAAPAPAPDLTSALAASPKDSTEYDGHGDGESQDTDAVTQRKAVHA